MRAALWLAILILVGPVLAGCGDGTVAVTGQVTIDGQPLPKGQIEFWPVTDGGTPVAGPIVAGQYKTAAMQPGEKKVVITEEVAIEAVTSNEELQRLAAEGKSPPPPPTPRIKPDTKGNGRQVSVSKETKSLDFALELK